MTIHPKFTDSRPIFCQEQAARESTLCIYIGVGLGFLCGVCFALMAARLGLLDALSSGGGL